MNGLIIYFIKVILLTGSFYFFYFLLLRRETFFMFNRFYLVGSAIISLVIPLLELDFGISENLTLAPQLVPDYWIGEVNNSFHSLDKTPMNTTGSFSVAGYVYLFITGVFLVRRCLGFRKVWMMVRSKPGRKLGRVFIKYNDRDEIPFSFFNYILIHKDISRTGELNGILRHELVHVKQFHTIDKIIMELLSVLLWFNPFIYYYRKSMTEVHEYLADAGAVSSGTPVLNYQQMILRWVTVSSGNYLVSRFTSSLTKKRLIMMTRINVRKRFRVKPWLVLPLLGLMVFSFGFNWNINENLPVQGKALAGIAIQDNDNVPSGIPFKEGQEYKISSGWGMRVHPISKEKKMHKAIDFVAPEGTPIITTADGIVEKVEFKEGTYGKLVLVKHSDVYSTLYTQLLDYEVKEGQKVKKGDVVGYLGQSGLSTGAHLHYEVHKNGDCVNPEDYISME
ncbi:MAG: peptidoglycan DD-metalloendopeptidase family protein [Bacteroidales bacterium]|nr:peptidoglycan DD-metalloendopeptidase family protein [Bacteroidales bacterium]